MHIEIVKNRCVKIFFLAHRIVEINYSSLGYLPKKTGLAKVYRTAKSVLISLVSSILGRMVTIVAKEGTEVIGTLSVYNDNGNLPIEKLFPEELKKIRETGAKIAYLGTLTTSDKFRWKSRLAGALFQSAFGLGNEEHVDVAVCVVNPCHVGFYKLLGFTEKARKDNMPGLIDAEAVFLALNCQNLNKPVLERMARL